MPVTMEQYRKLDADYGTGLAPDWLRAPELPVIGINWFMGAMYCNWLSKSEGLPSDQWCFYINGQTVKQRKNYLSLNGYRFPTEAEMEYATRSGAVTARYFGETDDLLPHYAWYLSNSQEKFWPVGTRKPNDFGLFDTHGNVFTWCQGSYQLYPEGEIVEDNDTEVAVQYATPRATRRFVHRSSTALAFRISRNANLLGYSTQPQFRISVSGEDHRPLWYHQNLPRMVRSKNESMIHFLQSRQLWEIPLAEIRNSSFKSS